MALISCTNSMLGGVPKQGYSSSMRYIVSTGRSVLEEIPRVQSEAASTQHVLRSRRMAIAALERGDLASCHTYGKCGKRYELKLLLANQSWPGLPWRKAYLCCAVAAYVG